jgi:sortase B
MKIRRGRSRVRTAVSCIIALICVAGIGYSGYKIIEWKLDSNKTIEQTEKIEETASVEEIEDDSKTETVTSNEPPNTPYWNYIKMKLIDVDFTELRKINNETGGWVQVSGTNINYQFVMTSNNDFYLNHSFDKSYSKAGWVFADFRNHVDGTDRNLILYAHGRYDATMFGTLRNILTSGWLNNSDNFTVRTVNDTESALWQVFSVYKIPTTNDYIQTSFSNDEEFGRFANVLRQRSKYDFKTSVAPTDKILTLSTCFSSTERVVLHAKLIKRAPRETASAQ